MLLAGMGAWAAGARMAAAKVAWEVVWLGLAEACMLEVAGTFLALQAACTNLCTICIAYMAQLQHSAEYPDIDQIAFDRSVSGSYTGSPSMSKQQRSKKYRKASNKK